MTLRYGDLLYMFVTIPILFACFVVGYASLMACNVEGLLLISVGIVLALSIIFGHE